MIKAWKFFFIKNKIKKNNPNFNFGGVSNFEFIENLNSNGYCYVGPGAFWSLKGGLSLGNNIIFGPKTSIWTYNHNYKSQISIPYGGKDILKPVVIGDNCWIGYGSILLPGTILGEGSIVSAGSVVSGNFPKCSLIRGNPAKVFKTLDIQRYDKLKKEKKFYENIKYKKH